MADASTHDLPAFRRVGVIGLGLLGGSVARRAHARGLTVDACDTDAETLRQAHDAGVVGHVSADPDVLADRLVNDPDALIVVATPVGRIADVLRRLGARFGSGGRGPLVTDVGSTKRSIVAAGEATLPRTFVGSHPMAGSELSGFAASKVDLFDQAACVVTPVGTTPPGVTARVTAFWKSLGMHVVTLSPEDHDTRVGAVSHLPHVLATALLRLSTPDARSIAGRGFGDATRLAAGDAGLWRDILLDNRDEVLRHLSTLTADLQVLRAGLDSADAAVVEAWLADAHARR